MTSVYTDSGALVGIAPIRTLLALSKVGLTKTAFTPSKDTIKADLSAIEADYTGYAQGTITAFLPPGLEPAGGATIVAPTIQFASTGPAVANEITGWWIETAAGVLVCCGIFDQPIPMDDVGNVLNFAVGLTFFASDEIFPVVQYS
jgi:hypothetical protein